MTLRSVGSRLGQSLTEVLIAIALASLFVIASATIIAPSLQIGKQTSQSQTKAELANELLGNVNSWAAANWNNILALATGTTNIYYLNTSSSPFFASSPLEQIIISGATYNRYFFVSDVYRDSSGNITTATSSANYDPSTKLITIVANTSSTNPGLAAVLSVYITRNQSNNFNQTSWSGGSGQGNPLTVVSSSFASSTNITVTATGSIQLTPGGGSCLL
jgi:hypothetical protein